jgi:hypothetical protein
MRALDKEIRTPKPGDESAREGVPEEAPDVDLAIVDVEKDPQ